MGRPVKLFKQFRSTLRYMQLDPAKVFSYPSVAWVRINRTKLKIVFFLDSIVKSGRSGLPSRSQSQRSILHCSRSPHTLSSWSCLQSTAVCNALHSLCFLLDYPELQLRTANAGFQGQPTKMKITISAEKKNSCKSIVLKRRYTIKQVGIKFNLPHDILCPSPRLSIDIQERSKARKRC